VSVTGDAWFDRDPDRLQWELDEFARHALEVEVDTGSLSERRLMVTVVGGLAFRGEPTRVAVAFPSEYPHFEPLVFAESKLMDRHQDPLGLNFCLLEDPARDWHPARSAGQLVGTVLRRLLSDTEAGTGNVREGETDMAEPLSEFFLYAPNSIVLVPEPFLAVELPVTSGELTLAGRDDGFRILSTAAGIGDADPRLVRMFIGSPNLVRGRWVSLDTVTPGSPPGSALLEAVEAADPTLEARLSSRLTANWRLPFVERVLGVTFLEEGPTRDEVRRTWVFADVTKSRSGETRIRRFLRAQALTVAERQRRIPDLAGLDLARIVVVGAGSLGAPVAVELAKAGVGRLDLIDHDAYDVNNSVRHLMEVARAGEDKSELVGERCRGLNPFVDVHVHSWKLGSSGTDGLLSELLSGAAAVVDTTGSQNVGRLLSDRCRAAQVPLVVVGLTAGSYGGEIFVVDQGPCIDCFIQAQARGELPEPPAGPRSVVTPIGCRHPAFSGSGFEATELAAIATRTVIRATNATPYPPLDANWIILGFRGEEHYREGLIPIGATCTAHPGVS
jgi:molybdopterin/thiamine biosynthesis adenylyltransferase